jgi:hypothetical protein
MHNKLLLFILIGLLVYMLYKSVCTEFFTQESNDEIIPMQNNITFQEEDKIADDNILKNKLAFQKDGENYVVIAFSQLKPQFKKLLLTTFLLDEEVNISKILDNDVKPILKFIDRKYVPKHDILFAVKEIDLENLTDKSHIGLNRLNNPIYSIDLIYMRDTKQRLNENNQFLIIEYNDNQNPSMSLVDFTNNKIQDKYITFISRELSDIENGKNYLINFIKLSDLNSNISII